MADIERYKTPTSLAEATEILRAGNVTVLAGGTDLLPQTQAGRVHFQPTLMNVRRVPELQGIAEEGAVVRIGALVTITELLESALVRGRLGILWQACDHFASDQIRNAATVGGNLCNASPAGDTLVPLLALDARVVLAAKPDGAVQTRRVPLAEFLLGPGRTCRAPTELLAAVEVPLPPAGFAGEFYKHGTRPGLDIAAISIAAGARRDGAVLRDVRIAFGAVAPTVIRAPRTEAVLEGRAPDAATLAAAVHAALGEIQPISDVRASDWYRRELIGNILKRVLTHACQM
ncbi:MAG: xanthine dehydrogenase family protein subunit M [Betaproteobacteria bacterium]|nr:xanthine dehydrogenase family protein subunit M [Betaproteobacteria bacterium]